MWRVDLTERARRWLERDCSRDARQRAEVQAGFMRLFSLLEQFGPSLHKPHVERLGDGLLELRYRQYRMFFCMANGVYLVFDGVVKKSQRLPPDVLETIRARREDAIAEWRRANGLA
jgi:phage-related protein